MKKYKDSSRYYFSRYWTRLIICAKNSLSDEMKQCLHDPDLFINKGVFLKDGNSSTVTLVKINDKKFVIKRYNIKSKMHALSRAFRPSRASVSWECAHMLVDYDVSTAIPIALIENRFGILRSKSFLITEFKEGECCFDYFNSEQCSNDDKKKAARSIIFILKKLESLKITHGDLKSSNILVDNNSTASLIDLDSMKQHKNNVSLIKAQAKDKKRFFLNWEKDVVTRKLLLDIYDNKK